MFLGRLLASVALSLAVASSTGAVPSVPAQGVATRELTYYPAVRALNPLPMVASRHAKRMTNAQRMARGLPPNAPRRRAPGQLRARTSPTPTSDSASATDSSTPTPPPTSASSSDSSSASSSAPSSSPSDPSSASSSSSAPPSSASSSPSAAPTCSTVTGRISYEYTDAAGFSQGGWLSAAASAFGEFPPTTDGDAALVLSYEVCGTPDADAVYSFTSSNGFTNFPILAAINGFASTSTNLGPGSYNYAYIGATGNDVPAGPAVTQPNSFSAAAGVPEGVETTIWAVGAGNNPTLTPVWINTDGTPASVQLAYVPASNAFALVGDMAQFDANFGTADPATFSFVVGSQH
ncbi:hypothetical protein PsYK624_046750 [Phanerochaete sordida]|uniref:Uncharacterized protein n=1 Tax=Phanerochaete sordida TaxID=48140 RepID=A0A9P3G5R5_9APHY|nr:hypothetical protein PsYK624_046750 [Phanerochaete sordida]